MRQRPLCSQRHTEENPHVCNSHHRGKAVFVKLYPKRKWLELLFTNICWFLFQNRTQRRLTVSPVLCRREDSEGQIPSGPGTQSQSQSPLCPPAGGEPHPPPRQESSGSGLLPGHWRCGLHLSREGFLGVPTGAACAGQKEATPMVFPNESSPSKTIRCGDAGSDTETI